MTLVVALGGVRSGKSAWAERQASELAAGTPVTVLATADPADPSMAERIAGHTSRRPEGWLVAELHGADNLAAALPARGVALLDGLGGWIAALMQAAGAFDEDPAAAKAGIGLARGRARVALQAMMDAAQSPSRAVVVVTEETGLGVVPLGAGTAAWVDLVGELNQLLVAAADLAVVVVAGHPLPLSGRGEPLQPPVVAGPLTVLPPASGPQGASGRLLPGERRAHPRLIGAGPARRLEPPVVTDATAVITPPIDLSGAAGPGGHPGPEPSELVALRTHGDRLVRPGDADHAVNIAAQGPPAWLTAALQRVIESGELTAYPDATEAEATLARLYGRAPEEVVATAGAAQALWLIPSALRPRLAACVHPLFTEAEAALRAHGTEVVRVLRDLDRGLALDPASVPDAADLVVLGNPTAASGTLTAHELILRLRRPGRTIVVDEAFMDLVPGEAESLASEQAPDVIVVRSFTKSLSVPGLRAGVALAAPSLAARLRGVLPPWPLNRFALAALEALGQHADELPARAERADAERRDLAARLTDVPGLRQWPSATNHVLVHLRGGADVAVALRDRQIAVRPCGSFPGLGDDHLRLTARDAAANARLVAALLEIVGGPTGSEPTSAATNGTAWPQESAP